MSEQRANDAAVGGSAWRAEQVRRLLAFGAASRRPEGGFWWLDDEGRPVRDEPVHTWITCRMTHVYALAQRLGHRGAAELVEHGVRALLGPLRDGVHGGWYPSIGEGATSSDDREAYHHAFVLLAGSSALAVGARGGQELFAAAAEVVDTHFWDDDAGMVVETWDGAWQRLDPYRGANSNMHMTEALLAAYGATGDPVHAQRAQRIASRMVTSAAAHEWRLPEHHDQDWRPQLEYNRDRPSDPFRPYGSTIGHGMEWARLLLHLRAAAVDVPEQDGDLLLDAARQLFDRAATDGWAVDGAPGFVYTVDWDGAPVVRDRMHWVVAEAIGAAAVLEQVTGDNRYSTWQHQLWGYAADQLIDPLDGSWRHQLDAANRPADSVWRGKPDVYHALQSLLLPEVPVTTGVLQAVAAR